MADLILPRGERKVLQAEDKDYKRGLLVKLLENGGYSMAYWFNKPDKPYPVEVLVDGKSIKKDAKVVEFKFHPKDYYDKMDEAKVYVKPQFAKAIDKAINQNKSISDKPGKLDSSLKVLKKIGKAYNHSLPLGFQWLWLKHKVDLLTPYQVKYFNRKKGTSAWKRKGSGDMASLKETESKMNVFYETTTNGKLTTSHLYYEENGKPYGYTFEFVNELNEAEYQGRKVKLNKIMQGDQKKFKVYVKNPKGNVVKVNFGQGGKAKGGTMRIRKSNPGARKSFRARHNCDNPGPKHKARYWACRTW